MGMHVLMGMLVLMECMCLWVCMCLKVCMCLWNVCTWMYMHGMYTYVCAMVCVQIRIFTTDPMECPHTKQSRGGAQHD